MRFGKIVFSLLATSALSGLPLTMPSAHAQISFPGFTSSAFGSGANQITLNGNASSVGTTLRLTTSGSGATSGSAFYNTKLDTSGGFYTDFQYSLPGGDGITFLLNNNAAGVNALGGLGGYMGYMSLPHILAVEFDNYYNGGTDVVGVTVRAGDTLPFGGGLGSVATTVNGTHDVRVLYGSNTVSVFLDSLSSPVLSVSGVNLNDYTDANGFTYVGFSAGEALAQGNQSILNWNYALGAPANPVPEPGNLALLAGVTVTGAGFLARRKQARRTA